MKFQPKRFVVEVKRGTSRAAFSSPDTSSDKFSNAEASLFGGSPKSDTSPPQAKDKPPSGVSDPRRAPDFRRTAAPHPRIVDRGAGRRLSSTTSRSSVRGAAASPGSKNKPKLAAPAFRRFGASASRAPEPSGPGLHGRASLLRAVLHPARHDRRASHGGAGPAPRSAGPSIGDGRQEPRPRLRERSSIIKRYVLGTEPKPGQIGSLRARRKARAAG